MGEIALFTVIKKVEEEEHDKGRLSQRIVRQRLVFDGRKPNLGWRDPP